MHFKSLRWITASLALAALPHVTANAQIDLGDRVTTPGPRVGVAVETVRTARLDRIYGVNTSDKSCQTYRPAGLQNPVIYRTDTRAGIGQIEIFAADTGLVLIGDNLDLVNSLVMKYDDGTVIKGDIVSRRAGKTSCREETSETVIVARFRLPPQNSIKHASLEIYAQQGTILGSTLTGTDPKTAPAKLTEAHNTKIRPKPSFGPVALSTRTIYFEERAQFLVTASNDTDFSIVTVTDRTLRPSPAATYATRSARQGNAFTVTVTAGRQRGVFNAALMPGIAITRQPEGSAPINAEASSYRIVNDTAWAGADATGFNALRKFGNTDVILKIEPRPSGTGTPPVDPVQPEPVEDASTIEAFNPGNRLFQVNGNTTDGKNHLSSLDSKEWCADLFKTAPDPEVSASFVYGEITLPPIRWGVKNTDSSSFTGVIKADLTKDARVKDTLNFNGTLAAGQTRLETFNRRSEPVAIAWDTVGRLCYYVGTEQDPVVENGRWVIQINEPGSDNERIFSAN